MLNNGKLRHLSTQQKVNWKNKNKLKRAEIKIFWEFLVPNM